MDVEKAKKVCKLLECSGKGCEDNPCDCIIVKETIEHIVSSQRSLPPGVNKLIDENWDDLF